MPNHDAVKCLERLGIDKANFIVDCLINDGYIQDVPLSEPEIMAEAAKTWLGRYGSTRDAFEKASGWSTASWRVVMDESSLDREYHFDTPNEIQWIFEALVIMAKEAKVL